MSDLEKLHALVAGAAKPPCAELIPCSIVEADAERSFVKVEFHPQPAFGNVFGHIQGGFAVAMMDLPISFAGLLKLQQWLPTVEIKTSFLAPAKLGTCIGEAQILRATKSIVFAEGRLWGSDGKVRCARHGDVSGQVKMVSATGASTANTSALPGAHREGWNRQSAGSAKAMMRAVWSERSPRARFRECVPRRMS